VPGAEYVQPSDLEIYLEGRIEGRPPEGYPTLKPRVNNAWPVRPGELYGPNGLRGAYGPASGPGEN
jgi:hypothetical protein